MGVAVSKKSTPGSRKKARPHARVRIRKTMEVDKAKLAKARRILGAQSDTQTIDKALDTILADQEIGEAMETAFGTIPDIELT